MALVRFSILSCGISQDIPDEFFYKVVIFCYPSDICIFMLPYCTVMAVDASKFEIC